MSTLAKRVAAKRREKNWSQRELARQAGVPHVTVSEIERCDRQAVSTDVAKKLARCLGVSVDYLIGTWDEDEVLATGRPRRA